MRDCENCARCGRDGCKSWDCDFIPRKEAIEAWKEKYGKTERMTEEEFDTMLAKVLVGQTDSTGSPIGDYRDGVGVWQTDCPWK